MPNKLVSCFWSGDAIRSRSVSDVVRSAVLDIPAPSSRLIADWQRETSARIGLEPGDVDVLPLARARARWPDYPRCVQALSDWAHGLGLHDGLAAGDVALMACRGARFHQDGEYYGGKAFCNLFLSEDRALDLLFPATGHRIPIVRGLAVLFDTCQPHAVIARHNSGFDVADFPDEQDRTQIFLSWELPIEQADITRELGIVFDIDPATALQLAEEQVWRNGARASVCPQTGHWHPTECARSMSRSQAPDSW